MLKDLEFNWQCISTEDIDDPPIEFWVLCWYLAPHVQLSLHASPHANARGYDVFADIAIVPLDESMKCTEETVFQICMWKDSVVYMSLDAAKQAAENWFKKWLPTVFTKSWDYDLDLDWD